MSINSDSMRTDLLESDEEYRQLYEEHQTYERKLEQLHLKSSLSEEDELEAKSIKRHKLYLKDRMESIAHEREGVHQPA